MSPMLSATALILASSAFSLPAIAEFAADAHHQNNCTSCHDSGVYTREDRRVTSFPALQNQVARCDANLGTQLFPEDLSLLVDHLNASFYHFAN